MSDVKSLKNLAVNFSLLYVEDDSELRESTVEIFETLFKEIISVENGEKGLYTYVDYFEINKKHFDIVVTDIQMPKLNGIGLIKEIFALNKNQKIVVVSAYDNKKYLLELINIGISGFIQKPLSSKQLISTLLEVCRDLYKEREELRFLEIGSSCQWDSKNSRLFENKSEIVLTDYEKKLLNLLVSDLNRKFTSLEIFEHIYEESEEFSLDKIKSILKRLRKKIPQNLILNTPKSGYSIQ